MLAVMKTQDREWDAVEIKTLNERQVKRILQQMMLAGTVKAGATGLPMPVLEPGRLAASDLEGRASVRNAASAAGRWIRWKRASIKF